MYINWNFYLGLVKTWLGSGKAQTVEQALTFAVQTLEELSTVDLSSNFGGAVLSIAEGLIMSNVQQAAVTSPVTGTTHPAAAPMTPAHVVALALNAATSSLALATASAATPPAEGAPAPQPPPSGALGFAQS